MEPNYLQIETDALRGNALALVKYVKCPVIGVLKCDGYGVSLCAAARAWQGAGVSMFAVTEQEDAVKLRNEGFCEDILLLTPVVEPDGFWNMVGHDIILPVTGASSLEFYKMQAGDRKIRIHVAVDTGLGRFGIRWNEKSLIRDVYRTDCFSVEGIYSHFSAAFEKRYRKTKTQLGRFLSVTNYLESMGIFPGLRHMASSSAALRFPDTRLDAVRLGSALVGRVCGDTALKLSKVGSLRAVVADVKVLKRGDPVGYGSICKADRDCRAAIVALGSENGLGYCKTAYNYPLRCLPLYIRNRLRERKRSVSVSFGDKEMRLIGRVGTQYSVFDVQECGVRPGDYVSCDADLLFPHKRRRFV